ncbi:hypothetical protein KCU65_g1584, partial [Aureobasidium melanogenum]
MEADQNNMSETNITPPSKPVDFAIRSEHGLGQLKRFPREIRNIVYSSMIPSLMVHGLETATIDRCVVRKLVNAPILATSKQLCVEFLESFMREFNLEESDEHHYGLEDDEDDDDLNDYRKRRPECLEELLAFVNSRINIRSESKNGLGLKMNWIYFFIDAAGLMAPFEAQQTKQLPKKLKCLWAIHEYFGVPSDKIFININYYDPEFWINTAIIDSGPLPKALQDLPKTFWFHDWESVSAKVTLSDESASIRAMTDMKTHMECQLSAYKASKLRKFRAVCTSEKDHRFMDQLLEGILAGFYQESCFPELWQFHLKMSKMAIELWKVKEEQYSVWHLFDLADSWLETENE